MCGENKYKIYILYHVLERELDGCLMIADSIKKVNPKAKVVVEEFLRGIVLSLVSKPDIILSIPPRDIYASNLLTIVKKATNCTVLSLMTEGYFQDFSDERIQICVGTNKYSPYLIDKYLFWGEKTRECLVKVLKANNKIQDEARGQAVGYVYYDSNGVKEFFKGRELPNELTKWKQDFAKRVLVLTGFLRAEYTHTELIGMSDYKYYGVKGKEKEYAQEVREWNALREKHGEYRKKYLNCIIELAKTHPDTGILLKLHPVELQDFLTDKKYQCYLELEQYNNIIILRENVLLGRILPLADILVHYGSTSGLEAYIYNIPTVQLYDSTYQSKAFEPGFCIYESTVKIDVNDAELFVKTISSGIEPRYLESVEMVLKEQFNWTKARKELYHPADTYAEIILDSFGNGQKIDDDEYRLALRSDQGFDVIVYFVKKIIQLVIHGKRKFAVKYWVSFKKLDISFYDCLAIGFCKVRKKIKQISAFFRTRVYERRYNNVK